ncbi:MAG: glycosyltransferase family 4 protein [Candidatus Bathyarchaeota archaeon]|nr:MAG: glycosyltransferase family 4 protein [Candidatus Bathyarchaeota archaeon]
MKRGDSTSKILVLAPIYSPCPHSPAQRFSSFVDALQDEGSEVLVVTCNRCLRHAKTSPLKDKTLIYNFRIPRFLLSSSFVVLNPIILMLYLFMGLAASMRRRFDIVFASVPAGETAVIGLLISRLFRSRLMIDIRDMYPPPPDGLAFLRTPLRLNNLLIRFFWMIYRNSDMLVCVDADIKSRLLSSGISSSATTIIPNGADSRIYRPSSRSSRQEIRARYGLSPEKLIFVYAGALAWYYPILEVAKGLKEALPKSKNIELLIVSHTDYTREKKLVKELGIEDYIKFMGPLPSTKAAEVTSACDVGLVVYRGEEYWKGMYGSKIFSYMACGLPILASGPTESVIHKLLENHRIGFFVGSPDPVNFRTGLIRFAQSRDDIGSMGKRARTVVEKSYDRRKLALDVASLVEKLQN